MAMELKLYQHIRKNFLQAELDLFDKGVQARIETYDKTIGLDEKILDSIKKYLKQYNTFLETQKLVKVELRYYQLLALYFTETFFLNKDNPAFVQFSKNALAYWMATGSGKTIIMHINILQFIEHNKNFKDLELIITTPGVNLIDQHEREVAPFIEYLNKIHRNKIRLTIDTTSALLNKPDDFFNFPDDKQRQRLILVDEAHIGLGKNQKEDEGEFLKLRRRLNIKHSFLFEYSATFHNLPIGLENEYSNSIVYDYNYNLFYRDGYGKDFYFEKVSSDILKKNFDDNLELNLKVIEDKLAIFSKLQYRVKDMFNAESFPDRPLIAFMGNTVNDKTKEGSDDELSDISEIVKYFAELEEIVRISFKNIFKGEFKGKLKLTRSEDDEILLSYGNGDYWGIINVGNGLDFINNFPPDKVDKVTTTNVVIKNKDKYLFKNIDKPESPINVLIGSRKFAEGWNCFRVSVIGLINLGKTKGNKIIQIFGRGVRLKGLKNDGRRMEADKHIADYWSLNNRKEIDQLKKLETLCVFSLQKSYLEVFTEAVSQELEIIKSFDIPVNPSVLKLNGEIETTFEKYSPALKIFKLSRTIIDVKRVTLQPEERTVKYEFVLGGASKKASFSNFFVSLDYRTRRVGEEINIKNSLKKINRAYSPFISYVKSDIALQRQADESNLQVYAVVKGKTEKVSINSILNFVDEIKYNQEFPETDFDFIEQVNSIVAEDFMRKLKNKINWHLNSSIYKYDELLKQSKGEEKGDFIEKYTLVKSFKLSKANGKQKTEKEVLSEIKVFTDSISQIENVITVNKRQLEHHIYEPLLWDNKLTLTDELKLVPDKLNDGERKFVKDFAAYVKENKTKFKGFDVYLMRNVESLKSIGIYLNDDSEVFYPDFIVWMISKDKVYINFIDPKGVFGLINFNELTEKEKVKIANKTNNTTLTNIENELKRIHKKDFVLNSFLLLRDSSPFGKHNKLKWKKENLISKNIFRLDWHTEDEKGNPTDPKDWVEEKNYLDWIFESLKL